MLHIKEIPCKIGELIGDNGLINPVNGLAKDELDRISELSIRVKDYYEMRDLIKYIGVTDEFSKIIRLFKQADVKIPSGFRPEFIMGKGDVLLVDLKRDIAYDSDGRKKPTRVLYSADSANPYEVEPIKNIIANLTCNPAIIYNLFINNPKINIGNKFKDRYEVIEELARILGPGSDISIEVDDPFAEESAILEEIAKFEEILTPYRLVVKVPHTGPVNKENVSELTAGRFSKGYFDGTTADYMYGHNLAYRLQQKGYRINFTLMAEPYQTGIGLQVRPYFINAFVKHRYNCSHTMNTILKAYESTGDEKYVNDLREYMLDNDYLSKNEENLSANPVLSKAKWFIKYRDIEGKDGWDGLDNVRHSLRQLRNSHLKDTRLIICSMDGEIYPNIDKMLMEPEFEDMLDRVVITAPPSYLAQFTSSPVVLTYQRMFMNAAPKC